MDLRREEGKIFLPQYPVPLTLLMLSYLYDLYDTSQGFIVMLSCQVAVFTPIISYQSTVTTYLGIWCLQPRLPREVELLIPLR